MARRPVSRTTLRSVLDLFVPGPRQTRAGVGQRLAKNLTLDVVVRKLDEFLAGRREETKASASEVPRVSKGRGGVEAEQLRLLERAGEIVLEERAQVIEAARAKGPPPGLAHPEMWRDFVLAVTHAHGEGCACALCKFTAVQLLAEHVSAASPPQTPEPAPVEAPTK